MTYLSPDGRFIVTTVWEQGQQDLWILTDKGQKYRRLTQDVALDMDPIWSPNGKRIYFSSDRDGILISMLSIYKQKTFIVSQM